MVIVLNCPGCGKRYEVDGSLAGKKSRCKQCGEVFPIPMPSARPVDTASPSKPAGPAPAAPPSSQWESIVDSGAREPRSHRAVAAASPATSPSAGAAGTIVLHCPRCQRRYEVDSLLAGKKSKCKDCGEVFAIPVPKGQPPESAPAPKRAVPAPAPVPSYWEEAHEDVPSSLNASRAVASPANEDEYFRSPSRASYARPKRRASSGREPTDPSIGITVAGWYFALSMLLLIGMSIWFAVSTSADSQVRRIFGICMIGTQLSGAVIGVWGSIWILVIAFREKLGQGLLVLLVPCYSLYYTFSRWGETKGAFALQMADFASVILFTIIGVAVVGVSNLPGTNAGKPTTIDQFLPGEETGPVLVDRPALPIGPGRGPWPGGGPPLRGGSRTPPRRFGSGPRDPIPQASVPRLPAGPKVGAPNPGRNALELEIPPDADPVTKSLIQLKSSDMGQKKEAIQRLGRTTPNDRLEEVVGRLVPLLDHDDGFLVNDVVRTLATWRSPAAVPALIERTSDNRFFVRNEAIKTLAKYRDARAIEPIAERLKEDGFEAEEALKKMGSIAEPALIDRLKSPDSDIRRKACNILKEIGGKETLKAMQSIPADSEFAVRVAAQDAMKQIIARVGPLPASARSGKASSSTPPVRKRSTQ